MILVRHGQSRFIAVFRSTRVDPGIPGHEVRNGQILAYEPAAGQVVAAGDPC